MVAIGIAGTIALCIWTATVYSAVWLHNATLVEAFCLVGEILLLEVSHTFYSKVTCCLTLTFTLYYFKVCNNYLFRVISRLFQLNLS